MLNIVDSLKHLFVIATAAVLALNPFSARSQKMIDLPPTPTEIIFQLSPTPIPTIDPDPVISCNINKDCGGGTKQLKSSICSNSTCCGFSNGKWVFYESVSRCKQDQNAQNNPLVNCVGPDNKSFQATQQECDKFNAAWGKPKQNNILPPVSQGSSVSTVTCVLSFGTYQLSQSSCDNFKKSDKPSEPSVTCVLSYGTFQLTQSSCNSFKSTDKPYVPSNNTQTIVTPDPVIQQQLQKEYQQYLEDQKKKEFENNQSNHGQCVLYAERWYTNQGTQCSGSCAQGLKQLAYPEYIQKLKNCDNLYPIE